MLHTEGGLVRLGYLLAESVWGRGLASELVPGLVGWCLGEPDVRWLRAGAALDNPASTRVLEKTGFFVAEHDGGSGEPIYEVDVAGSG